MNGWFSDNFSELIWENKYKGRAPDIYSFFKFLADEVSLGDEALSRKFFDLMWNKKFIPGGRILAFAGRPESRVSLMNCTTHSIEEDTLESISDTVYTIMRASSRGQGIGIDLSKLRPGGSTVNNAAKTSTGAISFMEMLNQVAYTIGQEGRRAALLFSLDIKHPDVYREGAKDDLCSKCNGAGCAFCDNGFVSYDFLNVKKIPGRVENANISLKLSDSFMRAYEKERDWIFKFNGVSNGSKFTYETYTNARKVMDKISKAAWQSAEPGVLFWDTSRKMSNSDLFSDKFAVTGTNACLAPDTKITTDIGYVTIEELASMPEYPKVLTRNERTGSFDWEQPVWVGITRRNATVISLEFTDGKKITLTPDHQVFTLNRGWVEAAGLERGDVALSEFGEQIEMGEMFIVTTTDTYDMTMKRNHNFFANGLCVHNCSEEILDQDGVCLLGSINLSAYVENPFTNSARFNVNKFYADVATAVEFLDNVIDMELRDSRYISERQKESLIGLRRIGLGVMGLADMLAMMGYVYGDNPATNTYMETLFSNLSTAAYKASIELAKRKGAAEAWNTTEEYRESIVNGAFFATLPEHLREEIKKYGTRNVTLLSIAPTGTISNLVGVSSGIEPVFARSYVRRTVMRGKEEYIDYTHPGLVLARLNGMSDSIYPTAYEISVKDHLTPQVIAQRFIDASISKTLNFPSSATSQDVLDSYVYGWRNGLKGLSVYVDGSRSVQTLTPSEPIEVSDACPECAGALTHDSGCVSCLSCGYSLCSL